MAIHKYTDWKTWWEGLRTNLIKCIGTTGSTAMVSLVASSTGALGHITLREMAEMLATQFASHLLLEAFTYCKNVQPQVITENVDTTMINKLK